MLSQMRDILANSTRIDETWKRMKVYMPHLERLLRSLMQRQRQEWTCLLFKLLHRLLLAKTW